MKRVKVGTILHDCQDSNSTVLYGVWSVNKSSRHLAFRTDCYFSQLIRSNLRVIPIFPEGVLEQTGLNDFQIWQHLFFFDLRIRRLHVEVFSKNDYLTDLQYFLFYPNLSGYIYSFTMDVLMALVLNCIARGRRTQSKVLDFCLSVFFLYFCATARLCSVKR